MSINFVDPFVQAATTVLATEVGAAVERLDVSLEANCYTPGDVTVLLSVVGDVKGVVLYSMEEDMALQLVATMLGQEQHEFDELAQSGIAEMGNVITGIATTYLAESGYRCTISVPTLIAGRGTMLSTLDFKRLVVPLRTDYGELIIHIALREDPRQSLRGAKNGHLPRTVER